MRILLLGADGFIGRHIAYRLRAEGHEVIASARRTARLSRMGFEVLPCDLTARAAAKAGFWAPHLEHVEAVINAAGLLTGTPEAFEAVHQSAPNAIYAAAPEGCQILLLSAIGIDDSQTRFARFRRDGERLADAHDALILRAGLVLGETSYGGSSLLRALAAIPLVGPYVGKGDQIFNPIHADDLAKVMIDLLQARATGTYEIGGPEHIAQIEMIDAYRQWLGLPQVRRIGLPMPLDGSWGASGI
ncbi:NAD-dependent epimerase/dehydratase family protein [Litorivita sp. NS0012-18]|uniref:NAD-dependent epimerase/dehydratase family protein n=1 Tax=Litorivita sp. NS0012-18 TaxID=3127655 RepID=UPI003109B3B3